MLVSQVQCIGRGTNIVLNNGAAAYKEYGQAKSRGTIPLQLAGNVKGALIALQAADQLAADGRHLSRRFAWRSSRVMRGWPGQS